MQDLITHLREQFEREPSTRQGVEGPPVDHFCDFARQYLRDHPLAVHGYVPEGGIAVQLRGVDALLALTPPPSVATSKGRPDHAVPITGGQSGASSTTNRGGGSYSV